MGQILADHEGREARHGRQMLRLEGARPSPADDAVLGEDVAEPQEAAHGDDGMGRHLERHLPQPAHGAERRRRSALSVQVGPEHAVRPEHQERDDGGHLREHRQRREEDRQEVEGSTSPGIRLAELVRLREEGQEDEQRRQQVLASHDPADRLYVDRQQGEGAGHPERQPEAPGDAAQEQEEQRHVRGVQQDVAEVIADGVAEAEEPRVERPAHVPHQQRLLAREVADEDLEQAPGQRALVVEIGMRQQDRLVIEVDEIERDGPGVEREAQQPQPEQGEDGLAAGADGLQGLTAPSPDGSTSPSDRDSPVCRVRCSPADRRATRPPARAWRRPQGPETRGFSGPGGERRRAARPPR